MQKKRWRIYKALIWVDLIFQWNGVNALDAMKALIMATEKGIGVEEEVIEIALTVVVLDISHEIVENQDEITGAEQDLTADQGLEDEADHTLIVEARVGVAGQGPIVEIETEKGGDLVEVALIVEVAVVHKVEEEIGVEEEIEGIEIEKDHKVEEDNKIKDRKVGVDQPADENLIPEIENKAVVEADLKVNNGNNLVVREEVIQEINKEAEVGKKPNALLQEVTNAIIMIKITGKKSKNIVKDKDNLLRGILKIDNLGPINHHLKKVMEIMTGQEILKTF